jgi:hypothetical protein
VSAYDEDLPTWGVEPLDSDTILVRAYRIRYVSMSERKT